jgi:hypothetical protein
MAPWYLHQKSKIGLEVPAKYHPLYRGINTGIMFMDLGKMRLMNWTELWVSELNSGRFTKKDYLMVRFLVILTL